MKLFLILLVVAVIAGSLFADYKWRQWIAARRRDHGDPNDPNRR